MPLTAQLGATFSRPGWVQPGFAITQGLAQWLGPFIGQPGAGGLVGTQGLSGVRPGDSIPVSPAVAASLVSSDVSWWVAH